MGRTVADRYVLGAPIGRGGMGTVYAAQHVLTGEEVALKLMLVRGEDADELLQRFSREVRVAARVRHPGIVRVQDAGRASDGEVFLVMELLRGRDLQGEMKDPGFELEAGVRHLRAALEPLAAAHAAGFVHRDLKPHNIYLHREDGETRVKILDFGIARDLSDTGGLTRTSIGIGTPRYMSPEQATAASGVGPTADVWSLGVILFQMIEGRAPFDGGTPYTTIKAACEQPTPSLHPQGELGRRLAPVVASCLEKRPEDRPADARALAERLDEVLTGPAVAVAPSPASATIATPSMTEDRSAYLIAQPRSRPMRLIGLLIVGAAGMGAGGWWWATRPPEGVPLVTGAPIPSSQPRGTVSSDGAPRGSASERLELGQPTSSDADSQGIDRTASSVAIPDGAPPAPEGRFGSGGASGDRDRDPHGRPSSTGEDRRPGRAQRTQSRARTDRMRSPDGQMAEHANGAAASRPKPSTDARVGPLPLSGEPEPSSSAADGPAKVAPGPAAARSSEPGADPETHAGSPLVAAEAGGGAPGERRSTSAELSASKESPDGPAPESEPAPHAAGRAASPDAESGDTPSKDGPHAERPRDASSEELAAEARERSRDAAPEAPAAEARERSGDASSEEPAAEARERSDEPADASPEEPAPEARAERSDEPEPSEDEGEDGVERPGFLSF